MGDINVAVNDYLADSERFADLFNVVVFGGEQVIAADELSELDTKARRTGHTGGDRRENDGKFHGGEYIRDQTKQWKKGAQLLVLGLEPEHSVHYALPVKLMKIRKGAPKERAPVKFAFGKLASHKDNIVKNTVRTTIFRRRNLYPDLLRRTGSNRF